MVCTPLHGCGGIALFGSSVIGILEYHARHDFDAGNAFDSISAGNSADTLLVIVYGGNSAGYMGSMRTGLDNIIVISGIIASVCATLDTIIGKVLVIKVYAAVYHRHNHIAVSCGIRLPNRFYINVCAGFGRIYITPLISKHRVIENGCTLYTGLTFHQRHALQGTEGYFGLGKRATLVIFHNIPKMETFFPGAGFKLPCIREKTPH